MSQSNPFGSELMALIVKHKLEAEYGVPVHIIYQIMISSFDNYCSIFRELESFYKSLEKEKEAQFEVETEIDPYESDRELIPHMD